MDQSLLLQEARTCIELIIGLATTLHYLGVPIRDKSYMFGDNKSVVDSSIQVNAKLHKGHTILVFHRIRECIASKIFEDLKKNRKSENFVILP
jgi:hypothetical protein